MTPNPLPDGWGHGRLDSVGTVHTGGTPPTAIRAYYGRDKLFVTPADLGDSKYVVRTTRGLSAAGFARSRRFPAGSVLVVCIGSTIGKVGLAAEELTANQQINAVVPDDQVDPEYLYYAVLTIASAIRERAGEQAVPLVNKSEFSTFAIPVPARAEQQRIATALADADALIHTHRRLIQKKHAVRKGIEQALLGGRTRLAGFSGAWRGVRLGDLLAFKNGLNKSKEFFGVGIPIVNFMDVLRNPVMTRQTLSGRVRLSHEEITRFSARKGDLFFTRTSESVDEVGTASVLNEHVDDAVFSGFVLRGRPPSEIRCAGSDHR
jgi:type I restriction enzyme S subunit